MRVKKILVPVIITSTVLIISCGSRQPVEEAMTHQTEVSAETTTVVEIETSISLFNASNGITPETAVVEAENTEPATTVNPEIQEIADIVSQIEVETSSDVPTDIPEIKSIDPAYSESTNTTTNTSTSTPEPTEPTQSNNQDTPNSSNTSNSYLKPPTEEERAAALQEVISDIPEAENVYTWTVTENPYNEITGVQNGVSMYIINGGYVRKEPNTDSEIIATMRASDRVIGVYGKVNEGNWYLVGTENGRGYLSGTFLSKTDPHIDPDLVLPNDYDYSSDINPLTGKPWAPGDEGIKIDPDGSSIRGGQIW